MSVILNIVSAVAGGLIVYFFIIIFKTPRPRVLLGDNTNIAVHEMPEIDKENIISKVQEEKKKYPPYVLQEQNTADFGMGIAAASLRNVMNQVSENEISRYEKDREQYFSKYEEVLLNNEYLANLKKDRLLTLEIVIKNKRNILENASITLHIPDNMHVISEDEFPGDLEYPDPPIPPRRPSEMLYSFNVPEISYRYPKLPEGIGPPQNISGFDIQETNSWEVSLHVKKIEQHTEIPCGILFVIFNSFGDVNGFTITYSIKADNIPRIKKGRVKIKPKKVPLAELS